MCVAKTKYLQSLRPLKPFKYKEDISLDELGKYVVNYPFDFIQPYTSTKVMCLFIYCQLETLS